ncbi:HipA N-terminal domain-containing protein [Xanthomonas nasturtii]|uniref:HipA N-terminal domain-containing protein n=1 Tax=Xanthomonas nasturtii TaxID=1843581 RepID=UPI003D2F996C
MRLIALIENQVIGYLAPDPHGHPRFTYTPDWQHSKSAIPLSLNLPLSKEDHRTEAVSAVLWGLLPDNEATLQRWASRFQVSPRNPLALLSHVGEDCAGAVQFVTEARLEDVLSGASDSIEPLTDGELEARLHRLRQDIGAARRAKSMTSGSSAWPARRPRSRCCTTGSSGQSRPDASRPRISSNHRAANTTGSSRTSCSACAWRAASACRPPPPRRCASAMKPPFASNVTTASPATAGCCAYTRKTSDKRWE